MKPTVRLPSTSMIHSFISLLMSPTCIKNFGRLSPRFRRDVPRRCSLRMFHWDVLALRRFFFGRFSDVTIGRMDKILSPYWVAT